VEIFVFLLIVGLIFGAVGVAIANNKNVDELAGFLLGAFLGPIGLIIVALLNPSRAATSSAANGDSRKEHDVDFVGERSFTSDAYRLWLADRYKIQRNDVFGRFVIGDRTFETLDAALAYCYDEEDAKVMRAKLEQERAASEKAALEAERQRKNKVGWVLVGIIFLGFCVFAYIDNSAQKRMENSERLALIREVEDRFKISIPADAEAITVNEKHTSYCDSDQSTELQFTSNLTAQEIKDQFSKTLGAGEVDFERSAMLKWKWLKSGVRYQSTTFSEYKRTYLCMTK
jgi:hypothetical protein